MNRQPITGPSAWHGDSMKDSSSWVHVLTARELSELDAALAGLIRGDRAPAPQPPSRSSLRTTASPVLSPTLV